MTQEEILKSKLKDIAKSVQNIAKCPVCLKTVKVPFKLCSRGHAVCTSCCDKLKECPTCEGEFTAENPVWLKNLLEALPRLCEYSGDGCEEILELGSDHKDFCGYRRILCLEYYCGAEMPLVELMKHYEEDHPGRCIYKNKTKFHGWEKFDLKEIHKVNIPVVLFDHIFFICIGKDNTGNYLKIFFRATPIGKLKSDFFVRVTFQRGEFLQVSTLKALVSRFWETLENYGMENRYYLNTEFCMRIPQSLLYKFLNEKGALEFKLEFFEDSS